MSQHEIDAWHLPGLGPDDVASWDQLPYDDGALVLRYPVLAPGAVHRLAERLVAARLRVLLECTTEALIERLGRAAETLTGKGELRDLAEAALPVVTGYAPAMIRTTLDRAVTEWGAAALRQLVRAELGDARVLDDYVPGAVPGVRTRAFGPELTLHIFAGNVPGVAVTSLVRSLLVRAATLGKTASGEPLLAVLFARALAAADADLASCLAVTYWPGGAAAVEQEALSAADLVVVYGGAATVREVARRLPAGVRLVEHGPRVSFGIVARETLRDEAGARRLAADVALATAIFDQQGCVSPHLVYCEQGGVVTAASFARFVAERMRELAGQLPRARLSAAEAAAIQDARAGFEFRSIAGEDVEVHQSEDTDYTVVLDPDPRFEASCLNRFLRVKPVQDADWIPDLVRPYRGVLQTVALAAGEPRRTRIAASLGSIGVTRVTDFRRMPWPPPTWHHDGRGPLRELLRWTDLEDPGEHGTGSD